jgi:4-hydroxy-tetrahydrodipicolinate synthase
VDWQGSYVAVVTPFAPDASIDEPAFRRNIEFLLAEGADGIVVSGCTGESWALTPDERVRLFQSAVETVGGAVPVIAGTGGVSTDGVVELSRRAREVGTAGIMVLPPYYCMAGRREVTAHYQAVSERVQHPILLYNIPRRTGFNLTPEILEEIVEIEWVVAIKESSNDFIQTEATIHSVGDRINVFTGHSAERGVPAVLMGAKGYVSSMESQVLGAEAIQMYDRVKEGKLEEARRTQLRTLALDSAMRRVGTFPANLKTAMQLLGRPAGGPRLPLLPLTPGEVEQVRQVLATLEISPVAA